MASVCIKTTRTISAKLRLTSGERQGIWMFRYRKRDMFEKLEYIFQWYPFAKSKRKGYTEYLLPHVLSILEQKAVYPI